MKHLFLGGPLHGEVREFEHNTTRCSVPTANGEAVYTLQLYFHSLTQRQFHIYMYDTVERWESWQVAQLLRAAGFFN